MAQLTKKEISLARNGKQILDSAILDSAGGPAELILSEKNKTKIALPRAAVRVLAETLRHFAEGREVVVTALDEELSTQEAAAHLKVSRPFLIKLLEAGEIPHRKVGKHRRVLRSDVESYKRRDDAKRLAVLNELAAQAQELKMGY